MEIDYSFLIHLLQHKIASIVYISCVDGTNPMGKKHSVF